MSRVLNSLPGSLGLLVALFASAGCESLIDLKERHLIDAGAVAGEVSQECTDYCALVLGSATAAGVCGSVYPSVSACEQTCSTLPRGIPGEDPNDPSDGVYNTFACRQAHAQAAQRSAGDKTLDCMAAGPGGAGAAGAPGCGTNCESYCTLYAEACPTQAPTQSTDIPDCIKKCSALRDTRKLIDSANGADHEGNTVQCRLVHVTNALAYRAISGEETNAHCSHAALRSSANCVDPPGSVASCDDYCQLAETACIGDQTLYENRTQCSNVCKALDPGSDPEASTGNTLACRFYHANNALLVNETHCGHAGAGGWDTAHCGDECASYCRLAKSACGGFATTFPGADPEGACRTACAPLLATPPAGYMGYNVKFGKAAIGAGDSLPCRLYFTDKALEDPTTSATSCLSALGAGSCAPR